MIRDPIYIDPYQNRVAQTQSGDIIGDYNAYMGDQQRLAAQNAWNAQQKAAGLSTNANVEALKQEKAENMVKISQLKAELAQLQASLGDEDAFSRELAANRAKIGDIAASRAHQQDIANRFQWKWQAEQNEKSRNADKDLQKRKEIQTLVGNIEDLDVMLAAPQMDSGTRDALLVKRKRMINELKALGKEYSATEVVSTASNKSASAKTISQLNEDYSNMLSNGYKKKYPSKADMDKFKAEIDKLQDSPEKTELVNKFNDLKSAEDVKAGEAKAAKANQAAVDEIAGNVSEYKLRKSGSYTATAKNGKTVTVTKNQDGNSVTVRCGSKSKVVKL